jgi:hypothetical protein
LPLKLRSVLIATAAITLGCASQGASGAGTNRNIVTSEELAVAGDVDLYQALERVRPTFLRSRIGGGTTGVQAASVTVYLDGIQMLEGLPHIRSLAAKNIQEVRFLEPQQANARFGGSNNGGALVITSKK